MNAHQRRVRRRAEAREFVHSPAQLRPLRLLLRALSREYAAWAGEQQRLIMLSLSLTDVWVNEYKWVWRGFPAAVLPALSASAGYSFVPPHQPVVLDTETAHLLFAGGPVTAPYRVRVVGVFLRRPEPPELLPALCCVHDTARGSRSFSVALRPEFYVGAFCLTQIYVDVLLDLPDEDRALQFARYWSAAPRHREKILYASVFGG